MFIKSATNSDCSKTQHTKCLEKRNDFSSGLWVYNQNHTNCHVLDDIRRLAFNLVALPTVSDLHDTHLAAL